MQLTRTDARLRENVRVMAMLRQHLDLDDGNVTDEERDTAIHAIEDEPRRRAEYDEALNELRSQVDVVVGHMEAIRRMLDEISA